MRPSENAHYQFGAFRLEPAERRLLRDDSLVEIQPKELDLLILLIERAGHLVPKDELLDALWPDAIVEENALSVQVSKLRATLGETAKEWRFVETVPRSGYRFAGPVRVDALPRKPDVVVRRRRETRLVVEAETGQRWQWVLGLGFLLAAIVAGLAITDGYRTEAHRNTSGIALDDPQPVGSQSEPEMASRALAEQAYAQGRAIWWTRTNLIDALEQFRRAIVHDSTFALAYVGIADVQVMGYQTGDEARSTLDKALNLDPELGEAYATLGFVRTIQEWDWESADEAFERALALAPDHPPAHQWYAALLMILNRPNEAVAELNQALLVAPPEAESSLQADLCQALYYAHEYEQSVEACQRALDLNVNQPFALIQGFWSLVLAGESESAARWAQLHLLAEPFQSAIQRPPSAYRGAEGTRLLYREMTRYEHPGANLFTLFWRARVAALSGDAEGALTALEEAVAARQFHVPFVNADPVFDGLRDHPRFIALMREIGLAG